MHVTFAGHAKQPQLQSAVSSSAVDHEDADGDVLMAEEEVEQLVASLQAARQSSSEWEHPGGHASISMLLFGHQVQCMLLHLLFPVALLHVHQ